MKFLLNENIPPSLCLLLSSLNYQAIHVTTVGLSGKQDLEVIGYAEKENMIILTHDLDYCRIISLTARIKPSVITFRLEKINSQILFELLKANIENLKDYLEHGVLVTIDEEKIRYRLLPMERG